MGQNVRQTCELKSQAGGPKIQVDKWAKISAGIWTGIWGIWTKSSSRQVSQNLQANMWTEMSSLHVSQILQEEMRLKISWLTCEPESFFSHDWSKIMVWTHGFAQQPKYFQHLPQSLSIKVTGLIGTSWHNTLRGCSNVSQNS